MSIFRSRPVANPHPDRPQEIALGRSKRSEPSHIDITDFVDVEKAKGLIIRRRASGLLAIVAKPIIDFSTLVKEWGMLGNNRLGDCTCAGAAHIVMIYNALVGLGYTVTLADVERMYEASGWNPANSEATDQGWTLEAAQEYLRTVGLLGKPDIVAGANVSLTNEDERQVAMELFGGLYKGAEIQEANMSQFQEGKPWDYVQGSPVVGGRCFVEALSELGKGSGEVTWGTLQKATLAFEAKAVDEARVFVPVAWQSRLPESVVEEGIVDFAKLDSLVGQYAV